MRVPALLFLLPVWLAFSQDTAPPAELARREIRTAHALLADADAEAALGRRLPPESSFLSEAQAAYQEALSNFEADRNLESRELAVAAKYLLRAQDLLLEAQQAGGEAPGISGAEQSARRIFERTSTRMRELQTEIRRTEIRRLPLDSISKKIGAILADAERSLELGQWQKAIGLTQAADAGVQAGAHVLSGRNLAAANPPARGKADASSAFRRKR